MMENVKFLDMCMCNVFAFQVIRAKEVRIDIEVTWSDDLWRFACGDVFFIDMKSFVTSGGTFWASIAGGV